MLAAIEASHLTVGEMMRQRLASYGSRVLFQIPGPEVENPIGCLDGSEIAGCFSAVNDLGAIDVAGSGLGISLWFKAGADNASIFSVTDGDPEPSGWGRNVVVVADGLDARTWNNEVVTAPDWDRQQQEAFWGQVLNLPCKKG